MKIRIKFTWAKLREIILWILPIITKGNNMETAPKSGLFTVPTTVITPLSEGASTRASLAAAIVPGAVSAGVSASTQVTVSSGLKVSWTQVGVVILQIIVFARYVGAVTGKFVIPLGLEESVKGIIDQAGLLWQSIAALVGLFALYRLREAMPAKVVVSKP